jgi:hypothetical protein
MRDLYFSEPRARTVLIAIGVRPAQIPAFQAADTFWPEVVLQLESGIVPDGIDRLVSTAARDHPGNKAAADLLSKVRGDAGPVTDNKVRGRADPVMVLCLLADPVRGSKLRIDREARLLGEIAEAGGIKVRIRHAVRVTDIIRAILTEKPRILHFAGHGGENGSLLFEDDRGRPAAIGTSELAQAVAATAGTLDCVVLNSCYTAGNAQAFRTVSAAVAGSVTALTDDCALAFARGFYTGLAEGQPLQRAFETGRAQVSLVGCAPDGLHFLSFPHPDE